MNTTLILGLMAVALAVVLAPLAAETIQKNGLVTAINSLANCVEVFPKDTGSLTSGLIYASNEERFITANYQEALTGYTVGWRDPSGLDVLLEQLFPAVDVGRRFEFKSADNSEAFLTEDDDERAIGASFKRVDSKGTSLLGKTINRGLTTRVDHDEAVGANWQQRKVSWLMQRITRNEFRRSLAILDAASTNNAVVWDDASNPDGAIRTYLRTATDASGVRPNIVLFGESAFDIRLDAYEAQNTPYAGVAANKTLVELAAKYMVDLVQTVKARYQSAAAAKTEVLGSLVYEYLAYQGADKDDPSNFKRFVSPTQQGTRWGVYVEPKAKFTDITVECYSSPTITSSLGIRKQTVSAS